MELLGSDNSEFRVVNFCPIPQNNNLEFYFYVWNHAFNLENIVQACLFFFPNPQGQ